MWLHLGTLLSGYPDANVGNAESYIGNMVGEVLTVCNSEMALKLARSHLLKTLKFQPRCAEVVEAIKQQQEFWWPKSEAIKFCDETAEELREALKQATEMVAAAKAERARIAAEKKRADDELRAQPLEVGDRVRHKSAHHLGAGQIVRIYSDGYANVAYDCGRAYSNSINDLRADDSRRSRF